MAEALEVRLSQFLVRVRRGEASARDRPPVSPVLSASWRSRASPACDTMPSPSAVTSRPFDHPVRFTFEVLLELALIRASALLSSQFRSTFYGRRAGQLSIPVKSQG